MKCPQKWNFQWKPLDFRWFLRQKSHKTLDCKIWRGANPGSTSGGSSGTISCPSWRDLNKRQTELATSDSARSLPTFDEWLCKVGDLKEMCFLCPLAIKNHALNQSPGEFLVLGAVRLLSRGFTAHSGLIFWEDWKIGNDAIIKKNKSIVPKGQIS